MNKYKLIALFGESGAGKDTIQQWMVSYLPNTKGIVSYTTRPKRDYEVEGKDYHFLTNEEFAVKVLDGTMLEATSFNDWFYGTAIDELDIEKINIGVFNINGIECLLEDSRIDIIPVYVAVSDKTRLIRALNREANPNCEEICRRFQADKKDFSLLDFNFHIIKNEGASIHGDAIKQQCAQDLLTLFD